MLDQCHSYIFDTTGCVIIKNVLNNQDVLEAKNAIISNWPDKTPWKFPVMHLGRVFWKMLTQELLLDFSEEFCGEHFRLDHAFGLSGNDAVPQLHGGPQSSQHSCFYLQLPHGIRKGIVGQLNVGFCLEPQNPKTGGFVYLPGSHKTADSRAGREILEEVYKNDFTHHSLVVPTLESGDMIIFTEALIHGDTGWKASTGSCRMQVYFKMTPGFMCWRDPNQLQILERFVETDLERRLIEPPWTGKYSETAYTMGAINDRRSPTRQ